MNRPREITMTIYDPGGNSDAYWEWHLGLRIEDLGGTIIEVEGEEV